ncbi:hypothetical protein BPS13_0140 [Bacillus phage BPS13]|uniref:Uncharacterized protein n=2 Tax=Wphvirus TaxID=1922327 RepID=W5QUB1_9CAUD|nr:hypothetical protein BPS13_0140 [Bacillus phage BPS13]YP_009003025.1 hypothetical protein BPS10C_139 [Bacillus phage BPS10C]QQO38866.1 hypothetical protein BCPG1_135 [Bacillus phage BCPG1]QSJ04652.1 hypothetical protein BCP18_120 [Bacillus phage BCP18]AEZ50319.1 hypothetical protein BPS13_0140 [Bacillus phage BPS13]AGI12136.1 hypothetical protein BPS10C_139 [Bacillus phage BPS10C]
MSYAERLLNAEYSRLAFLNDDNRRWMSYNEDHPHYSSVREGVLTTEMHIQDLEAALNILKGAN